MSHEELHSLDAWKRACEQSQRRAVENRARAARRRSLLHVSIGVVLGILLAGAVVLTIWLA